MGASTAARRSKVPSTSPFVFLRSHRRWFIGRAIHRGIPFAVYDRTCKQSDPTWTTAQNRKLMQKYLLGTRGMKRKSRHDTRHRPLRNQDNHRGVDGA